MLQRNAAILFASLYVAVYQDSQFHPDGHCLIDSIGRLIYTFPFGFFYSRFLVEIAPF